MSSRDLENGIALGKIERMWATQFENEKCNSCAIKPICGGECKIVSYNQFGNLHGVDENMCKIKRHLYRLSVVFCEMLKNEQIVEYDRLVEDVSKIDGYYLPDERLIDAVHRSNGKYTFSQLKKIKDNDLAQFNSIYSAMCS